MSCQPWTPPLALLAATLGSCVESDRERRPDVLLITIDTIRADAVGCYGNHQARTPHIDALAAAGARFQHAFAPRGATLPSLTTILTGVSPLTHGVINNNNGMQTRQSTLAEILRDAGYATAAFLTNQCVALVEWPDQATRGFDVRVCAKTSSDLQRLWDENATELAIDWIEQAGDGPILTWVHLMDPHGEHRPYPALYRGEHDPSALLVDQSKQLVAYEVADETPPRDVMETLLALYDAEIEGVDARVGELVAAIQARGPDPIIVLAGDHGEELFEHDNFRGHSDSIHDSVLRVPLLFRGGSVQPGATPVAFAELEDILPTLLDLLGLESAMRIQGESLAPRMTEESPSDAGRGVAYGHWGHDIITVRSARHRYVWNPTPGPRHAVDAHRYRDRFALFRRGEQLFDLRADPGEQHDLLAAGTTPHALKGTLRAMRHLAKEWRFHERHLSSEQLTMDDERANDERLLEELRQLGYR